MQKHQLSWQNSEKMVGWNYTWFADISARPIFTLLQGSFNPCEPIQVSACNCSIATKTYRYCPSRLWNALGVKVFSEYYYILQTMGLV